MPEGFPEFKLDPKTQAMINASNAARAAGIDPSVTRAETDDDKSYATVKPIILTAIEIPVAEEAPEFIPDGPRELPEVARRAVALAHDIAARSQGVGSGVTEQSGAPHYVTHALIGQQKVDPAKRQGRSRGVK